MAIYSLRELLSVVIRWEEEVLVFYGLMQEYLVDERSRRTAGLLAAQQTRLMAQLKSIDVSQYRRSEYLKSLPTYSDHDIPGLEVLAHSAPEEIFERALEIEEKLEEKYAYLRERVVFGQSKALLDMLLSLKIGQIKKIKALMDSAHLVF